MLQIFNENGMTANTGNFHFLLIINKQKIFSFRDKERKIVKMKVFLHSQLIISCVLVNM